MNTMREKQAEEAVLRMDTMYGELDSLLFRRGYEEGWGMSREDPEDGYAMSYTINFVVSDEDIEDDFVSELTLDKFLTGASQHSL